MKIALDNHDKPKDERKSGREDILKKKEVIAVEAKRTWVEENEKKYLRLMERINEKGNHEKGEG